MVWGTGEIREMNWQERILRPLFYTQMQKSWLILQKSLGEQRIKKLWNPMRKAYERIIMINC